MTDLRVYLSTVLFGHPNNNGDRVRNNGGNFFLPRLYPRKRVPRLLRSESGSPVKNGVTRTTSLKNLPFEQSVSYFKIDPEASRHYWGDHWSGSTYSGDYVRPVKPEEKTQHPLPKPLLFSRSTCPSLLEFPLTRLMTWTVTSCCLF